MTSSSNRTAYIVYGLLGLVWGSTYLFNKMASDWLSPQSIVLVRVVTGFLPVLLLALAARSLRWWHLRYTHHFLVMSVLAAALYYYAFAAGVERLPSGVAGMLAGTIPLISFIGATVFLRDEPVRTSSVLGVLCGLAGVLLVARPWTGGLSSADLEGVAYMLAGSASVGLSFVYAKRFLSSTGIAPIALCTYQLGLASLILLIVCDIQQITPIFNDWPATTALFLGAGFLGTGLAYTGYYYLVDQLGAIKASSVTYLPPIVALFIGVVFAGENLSALDIVAAAAILLGVFLMQAGKRDCLRRPRSTLQRSGHPAR